MVRFWTDFGNALAHKRFNNRSRVPSRLKSSMKLDKDCLNYNHKGAMMHAPNFAMDTEHRGSSRVKFLCVLEDMVHHNQYP